MKNINKKSIKENNKKTNTCKKICIFATVGILITCGLSVCFSNNFFANGSKLSKGIPTANASEYAASAYKNIVKGDSKENIKKVQTALNNNGANIGVDGIWGAKTRAAVVAFQKKKGLAADGVVGSATEKALGITLSGGESSDGKPNEDNKDSNSNTTSSDQYLLAKCIYAESRGEPYLGQVAVGAVVLNRVRSAKFPNTISGVIYQPWAFTAVNDGQINLTPNETAVRAARDALSGWDPTNGCLYYYNPATATSKWIWSLKVSLKIGRHSFAYGQ